MSEIAEIIGASIEKFDELRGVFFDAGIRCFLLKRGADTKRFVSIAETTTGWFINYDTYREQLRFEFATTDSGFANLIAVTSHVGCGVPDAAGEIEVYSIDDKRRDVIPPVGNSPTWKAFGIREPKERFKI